MTTKPLHRSRTRDSEPSVRGYRRAKRASASTLTLATNKELTDQAECNTLLDMKTATLSIRLDKDLNRLLGKASRQVGQSRSEVAREALRRQLRLTQFEAIRRRMMPFAEARGFLTDEDVFSQIS